MNNKIYVILFCILGSCCVKEEKVIESLTKEQEVKKEILEITNEAKEKNKIKGIKRIEILDLVNINYEKSSFQDYFIEFKEYIEVWNTNRISYSDFIEIDSIKIYNDKFYEDLHNDKTNNKERTIKHKNHLNELKNKHKNYNQNITPSLESYLNNKEIENLLSAVKAPIINKKQFLNEFVNSNDSILIEFENIMTSYYPLIGVTIIYEENDSLVLYCEGQRSLATPWYSKNSKSQNYNPKINWAIYHILPNRMKINKNRLTQNQNELKEKLRSIINE